MIRQAKVVAKSIAISFELIWNSYFSMEQIMAWIQDGVVAKRKQQEEEEKHCHSGMDGDCEWEKCPQLRDGEPVKSGRHCPLDNDDEEW